MSGLASTDLTDLDNFTHGFPHHLFELHRREAPVWWHEPTEHTPDGEGFWSVATYDETLAVLSDPSTYSSERGGEREHGGTLLQDLPIAGVVLNMMDDPRHSRIRRLVTKGLTPMTVRSLETDLRRRTCALLDGLDGECDFLTEVAAELPMQAICFLLGIPEDDRHRLFHCIEHVFDLREEDYLAFSPERAAALQEMSDYGTTLIANKRRRPAADMLSDVIHAELADVEPPRLTDDELYSFFSLVFSAGSDTTRNAVAGGLLALLEHPDQLGALRDDGGDLSATIEEILRWTSPSPSKRRTATEDTTLGGHSVRAGEKVLVWEGSANRDEDRFERSMSFDIHRHPNPHLAFGHGAHFCLGAHLARLEIRIVLEEVLATFADIELAGSVEWSRSNRHTGIRHLPVRLTRQQ